jgi:hypothetical protein
MKNMLFIVALSGISFAARSQVSSPVFNYSNSTVYSLTLPDQASPWLTPNNNTPAPSPGSPATAAFIEFGDGTFSFLPNGSHIFMQSTSPKAVITKTTGVYGGGGKPPAVQVGITINGSAAYSPMNIITNSDMLAITPNIGSVLARDTMILVVTYKTTKQNPSLLFLFNDNTVMPAFEPVAAGQMMTDNITRNTSPFLRTYAAESEITLSAAGAAMQTIRNTNNQFVNNLCVKGLINDGVERNIFITLVPREGLLTTSLSQTKIKAVLVYDNTRTDKQGDLPATGSAEKEIILPVVDRAHDPNYITVNPVCMLLPKAGKALTYKVHFQNTGSGMAARVRVAVKLPENIDGSADVSYDPVYYRVENGIKSAPTPFLSVNRDSLVFEFIPNGIPNCTLEGIGTAPDNLCNTKTMGDFWFTVKTNNLVPDLLLARASIVFYNTNNTANDPILTNTAVSQFRACCDCSKKCDPCKNKKGLWKWLFCKKC